MKYNFDEAFELTVMDFEGGDKYTDDPLDVGAETKFGISKKYHPEVDVPNVTKSEARDFYKDKFWNRIKADQLPSGVDMMVFDCAVQFGIKKAVKALQFTVGTVQDGILGSKTLKAVENMHVRDLICMYTARRCYLYSLSLLARPSNKRFIWGWQKRSLLMKKEAINHSE